jgi:hypothetical protein
MSDRIIVEHFSLSAKARPSDSTRFSPPLVLSHMPTSLLIVRPILSPTPTTEPFAISNVAEDVTVSPYTKPQDEEKTIAPRVDGCQSISLTASEGL